MINLSKSLRALVLIGLTLCLAVPSFAAPQGVVNINSADAETLSLLPRIGPAVAARIVDYRTENGSFETKADLMLVRGIGERTYELLEQYVVLKGESTLNEKVRVPRSTPAAGDSGQEG